MLAAMSLNLWILAVIVRQTVPHFDSSQRSVQVTSLAVGQFIVELAETPGTVVDHPESGHLLPLHSRE